MIDNTAKTLNWLKFNPVIYVNSDLCLFENYHIQGLYMHVIAFYWQKKGEVSLKALQAKFGDNAEEIQHLLNESYLQLDGDMIHIDWLDIKIAEAIKRSVSGSQNASKRWNCDATAMPPQCDRNAKRKEKKEKEKSEYNIPHKADDCYSLFDEYGYDRYEAQKFFNYYDSKDWRHSNGHSVTDWQKTAKLWISRIQDGKWTEGSKKKKYKFL